MRSRDGNGSWDVHSASDLNEVAGLLTVGDDIVLGLPIDDILSQRLSLLTNDPSEFSEMDRIQIEKTMPYPPE